MNGEIDVLMRRYDGTVPGASLLVVRDGVPVVRRAWGFANLEDRVPAAPETNYRLASITKQFTAAAILLLRDDGKLAIDDEIGKWLPSLPASTRSASIRQLLIHTSGIIDYEDLVPDSTTRQLQDSDVLRLLEPEDSTYFPPGTAYRYGNSAYALLALIVERASGRSFATFLHDRIFVPLGMNATVAHQEGVSSVASRAFGYTFRNGAWVRKDQSVTSAVLGDGGIYSSIDDLAMWDAALYDSRLLSDESRKLAFAPHTVTDKADVRYGFGWRITGETFWHSGETSGFRNVMVRYPERRMTVIMLTNRDDPEPYELALTIARSIDSGLVTQSAATNEGGGIELRTDKSRYRAGENITLTLANGTTRAYTYNPCTRIVEREVADVWTEVAEDRVCPMIAWLLEPRSSRSGETELPVAVPRGRYRAILVLAADDPVASPRSVRAVSAAFEIY